MNLTFKGKKSIADRIIESLFFLSATVCIFCVILIMIYILINGLPSMIQIGPLKFLFGMDWAPSADIYGIFPMIFASLIATFLSVLFGSFIGIFTAVLLAEIVPKKISNIIKFLIDILAGIPSVIYGFWGMIVLVPFIKNYIGGFGNSLLAVVIILTIMILPTIISLTKTSIEAVPETYKEASLALGATKITTIFKIVVPAAKYGILAAITLGIGRAVGETMAVLLVAGNKAAIPKSILDMVRTLTGNIALEMSYAKPGLHQGALFACGVVLFIAIMILNLVTNYIVNRGNKL